MKKAPDIRLCLRLGMQNVLSNFSQKSALRETKDPATFEIYGRLTSLLFKISPSS